MHGRCVFKPRGHMGRQKPQKSRALQNDIYFLNADLKKSILERLTNSCPIYSSTLAS